MKLFNFPLEVKIGGKKTFPTVARLPEWMRNTVYRNAVAISGKARIEVIGPYSEKGLEKSMTFPDAPDTIDWNTQLNWVRKVAPLEEEQIVEWMHNCAVGNILADRFMLEYKRLGSSVIAEAGDPYIPGVKTEDIYFKPELGRDVASRGNAVVVTNLGNFNVPVPGKATGVFKNLLAWGAVLNAFIKQWEAILVKFRELATNPNNRISFLNFGGLTAPLFFVHSASIPSPINIVEFSITTNKPQKLKLKARNTQNYTNVHFEDEYDLSEGQNVLQVPIFGFPIVPSMVIELQPENQTNTILDYYNVYP